MSENVLPMISSIGLDFLMKYSFFCVYSHFINFYWIDIISRYCLGAGWIKACLQGMYLQNEGEKINKGNIKQEACLMAINDMKSVGSSGRKERVMDVVQERVSGKTSVRNWCWIKVWLNSQEDTLLNEKREDLEELDLGHWCVLLKTSLFLQTWGVG